jgi:predicted ribosome quality control (RQC) complex YloA/Tae2 family protein
MDIDEIKMFYNLSAVENANRYFELAKRMKKKAEGAKKAVEKLKKEAEKKQKERKVSKEWTVAEAKDVIKTITSAGLTVEVGKEAGANERLYRSMTMDDLFFHADIPGAATVVLRKGASAPLRDKLEAATLAASYSKAWKLDYNSVHVYAVMKDQIKPLAKAGMYIFEGEREWFRSVPLRLVMGIHRNKLNVFAANTHLDVRKPVYISPGGKLKKDAAAKWLAKHYGVDESGVKALLPSGRFHLKRG